MALFSWFSGLFGDDSFETGKHDYEIAASTGDQLKNDSVSGVDPSWDDNAINPTNGLPMVGGTGGIDVEGNLYGTDFNQDDLFSSINNSFSSGSSFDDL